MTTHFPAEIELTCQYRDVADAFNPGTAAVIFHRLWIDLAFQTRLHGNAGYMQAQYVPGFLGKVEKMFPQTPKDFCLLVARILLRSKLIVLSKNGDWFCPLFFECNGHLDKTYIAPSYEWAKDWDKFIEKLQENGPLMSGKVARTTWYRPDGEIIPEVVMNKALVLLNNLDTIIHRKARKPGELPAPLIHAACDIVKKHGDLKLHSVCRRFMAMSRPRQHPLAPTTTEDAVRIFDDLIVFVCPDEGFDKWSRKIECEQNEAESITEDISKELNDAIAAIPDPPAE